VQDHHNAGDTHHEQGAASRPEPLHVQETRASPHDEQRHAKALEKQRGERQNGRDAKFLGETGEMHGRGNTQLR